MGAAADRIIYVGTMDGAFLAERDNGGYKTRSLGLQGKGAIRSPILIDREDSKRLFAVTSKTGVFRSEDGGATWVERNEGIISKEGWSVAQARQTGTIYVGTGPVMVFKSTDGGDTWEDCEHLKTLPETKDFTFPGPPYIAHVKSLAVHPDNPDVVFGAVEEGWLIRTLDGGKTWACVQEGTNFDSHSVSFIAGVPDVVLSTAGRGFYRSDDRGEHFTECVDGLEQRYLAQVVVHPSRPDVLFTAGASVPPPFWRRPEGAASGLYRSESQGKRWERLTGGLPEHIKPAPRATAGDPEDPNAFLVGLTDGTIWESNDGGEAFACVAEGLPQIGSLRVTHR
jgi:photosystem II stability/assembly factor-like uncharacterized protein